jgi:hypothetical protein
MKASGERCALRWQILLIAFAMTTSMVDAQAQERPRIPSNPISMQECESFTQAFKAYLDQLHDVYLRCSLTDNANVPVSQWRPGYSCSAATSHVRVDVAPSCVRASDTWDCETAQFSPLMKQCAASVRQRGSQEVRDNKKLKETLQTALGGAAKDKTMGLAKWWAGRSDEGVAALLSSIDKTKGYGDLAVQVKDIMDSTKDPLSRTQDLVSLFNRARAPLAQNMTKIAVHGVVATAKSALGSLDEEISDFDASVDADSEALMNDEKEVIATDSMAHDFPNLTHQTPPTVNAQPPTVNTQPNAESAARRRARLQEEELGIDQRQLREQSAIEPQYGPNVRYELPCTADHKRILLSENAIPGDLNRFGCIFNPAPNAPVTPE